MKKYLISFFCLSMMTAALASELTWIGYKGLASEAGRVTTFKEADRGVVTRIETVADGGYQGAVAKFETPVDLSEIAEIEFDIRHNIFAGKCGFVLRFEQPQGIFMGTAVTPSADWHKVSIKLNEKNFSSGSNAPLKFGTPSEMRMFPYDAMNKKGMFVEIANFRFVTKKEATAAPQIIWDGYKGLASTSPQINTTKDAKHGTVTRIETVVDGGYQGVVAKFSRPVELDKYKAIEFEIRNNISGAQTGFILRFEQPQGMFMGSVISPSPEWEKITVPFDEETFSSNGSALKFGTPTELRLYPYEAMNKKGMFIEIAKFRFVPKDETEPPVETTEPEEEPVAASAAAPEKKLDIVWGGYQGQASVPAHVKAVQNKKYGAVTRIEAAANGGYQGATAKFTPSADIKNSAALEFDIRHNISKGKTGFIIRFEQPEGMFYGSVTTASSDWQKVSMPFDAQSFTPESGNTVTFAQATEMRIYPYEAMDKKGEFIEIANFRLVPKTEVSGPAPIKVMSYRHLAKPTSGDSNETALVDGNKTNNVFYRQFSEEPDVVFDLGGRYVIDSMTIDALAAPSHNFSEIAVMSSFNGKDWIPGGILKNNDSGTIAKATSYTFTPGDKPVIGRYIRIRAARPRSDFTVNIAEVSFIGHTPSADELKKASELNYDTGVVMPKRNTKDYVKFQNGDWQLWISRKNGVVNGVFYKGKLLVERFTPRYTMQTRARDTEVDGNLDKVEKIRQNADSVTMTVTNAKLPGLAIERTWKVENNALMEKVTVINRSQKERVFLRLATEVIFEQQFRKNGFYEMPSSALASGMFRIPTSEVQMDRAMTNIPTLAIENGKENMTVWHTRYRFNDRFTYYDIGTEEDNLQIFRANGWLMTGATVVPADKARQSFENRFSVTDGGMLKAYDEYINLPEVAEFRGQLVRPKWLRDIRAGMAFGWDGNYPESSKRLMTNYATLFSHRGALFDCELIDMDGIWGDLPVSGKVRGSFGEYRDATEIRQRLRDIKAFDKRFKIGIYTWFWSAFPWSTPVKNHPEWFVKTLRSGAKASWFPGVNVNYLRFWGIPESRQEAVEQVVRFVNYYEQDNWYVDGGKSGVYAKDWDTMRIDDPLGQTDFYLEVRKRIRENNPERIVYFNHSENPIGDMGFLESFGGTLTNEWRRGAILMWKFKMYSYKDPLKHSVYSYWLPGVDGALHNYIAGIGAFGDYSSRELTARDLPYIGARYDIRCAQICDAHVSPDWRFDFNEELECMTLNQQNNAWIFMHYHGNSPAVREVSADMKAMGIIDESKPVYLWHYIVRDARKNLGTFGEPQIAKAYAATGWVAERGVTMEYLGKQAWSPKLARKFKHDPGQAQVLMVSQVPAVVISVENDPVHYYLAGQPGIEVNGGKAGLQIKNEYEVAEIGMILDDGEVPSEIKVNGESVPFVIRSDRNFRCAVFKVGNGESNAEFTYEKRAAAVASELEVSRSGNRLSVRVIPENASVEIHYNKALVISRTGSFELDLPDTVNDGIYKVSSGKLVRTITINGVGKKAKILPILVALPDVKEIKQYNKLVRGIEVLGEAYCYSDKAGRYKVDSDKLTIEAGTIPYYESHYNNASAALELKVKSYMKLRIVNGVIHHSRYAYEPQNHSVRGHLPGVFCGLNIDFGTPDGYTSRSAAGFGVQNEGRLTSNQTRPEYWGKKGAPDHVYELSRFMQDTKNEVVECWIDLNTLGAPANWDGRIWFTMHTEHLSPDRIFTVEVLETSDILPSGAKVLDPQELGVKLNSVLHSVPHVKNAAEAAKVPVLGKLIPEKGAVDLTTEVKVAYDNKNLYFFYDCREEDGHILYCEGGRKGAPWEGDSVEFFVQRTDRPDETLHGLVDAENHSYAEATAFHHGPGKKVKVLSGKPFKFKITVGKPHWKAVITIPWAEIGGMPKSGTELGFNLMRNRNEQGKISCYTLSNNTVYLSAGQCRMLIK